MKSMSFSHQVKDELAHQWAGRRCCRAAELAAIIRMDGRLHLRGGNRYALHLAAENAAVTRKSLRLLSDLYNLPGQITVRRSRLSRANNYLIYVENPGLSQALNELGVLDDSLNLRSDVPGRLVKSNCCAAAYIRGSFLGGGFVSSPRGQYHLELTIDNPEVARTGRELLSRFDIDARIIEKGSRYTLYLKQAQAIVDFLALVGAYSATLAWEDVRTVKDVRANVNRLVNCDTANLNKAVRAAMEQIRDIMKIDKAVGLGRLPRALEEIAQARLDHPQANLVELGEACEPKLTKSAAYHRVRRLQAYAAKL
jgi:DNA-binding protein WhiA